MTKLFKDPKDPAESIVIEFDFSSELTTLIDSAVVTVAIHGDGIDSNVAAMLVGAAQISGNKVLQRVSGGVDGVNYRFHCAATYGSDVIVRAGVMAVRNA